MESGNYGGGKYGGSTAYYVSNVCSIKLQKLLTFN